MSGICAPDTMMSLHERWARIVSEGLARRPRGASLQLSGLDDRQRQHLRIGVITVSRDTTPCSMFSCPQGHRTRVAVTHSDDLTIGYSTIPTQAEPSIRDSGTRMCAASRESVADGIEVLIRRKKYDAVVGIAGGDKTLPGLLMAIARLNVLSVVWYGGVIRPESFVGDRWGAQPDPVKAP